MRAIVLLTACLLLACPFAWAEESVLARLSALPGVDAEETTTFEDRAQGLQRFLLHIEQPVDHFTPGSRSFKQKLVLFHRGFHEPMLLQTSGYAIFSEGLSSLAKDFATNQLQVEHRYFAESIPSPAEWPELNVRQSVEDFHHIVRVFKALYSGRWVNTGSSKGGMTSIFHRRFYPADLEGTVANVAPISFSLADSRYVDFVEKVGGEKYLDCRQRLEEVQRQLLRARAEILARMEGEYRQVDKDLAFETAVVELPFAFWQYGHPEDPESGCAKVPGPHAAASELWDFLRSANDPVDYGDVGFRRFAPYFYQVANELGQPDSKLSHLAGLLAHPYALGPFLPVPAQPAYSNALMREISQWVAQQAKGMMFFYGEYDPWTAGALRELSAAPKSDNHFYMIAGGNHGANWALLPQKAKAEATAVLARWFGKAPAGEELPQAALFGSSRAESLEEAELREKRRHRAL